MARAASKTPDAVLKEILDEYFDDMDQDVRLAESIIAHQNATVPFAKIKRDLGLDS